MLLSLLLTISQCAFIATAAPTIHPPTSLSPRTLYCSNIPNQVAGSLPSKKRAPSYAYCARGSSRTFVLVTLDSLSSPTVLYSLLQSAMQACATLIQTNGDTNISGGAFSILNAGFLLRVQNANNHQLTYRVLGAALIALDEFMTQENKVAVNFEIWDGDNQVGEGAIGGL
ncbi:hypothetical protein MMC08_008120 [Hypocenomyce scalaris]|nr:hypothetical protein [Hypocenomyce scalaris]